MTPRCPPGSRRGAASAAGVAFLALVAGLAVAPGWAEETTAVAVAVDGELPALGSMAGWFLVDGEPRAVLGVQAGPAEVVVVRDPAAQPFLDLLMRGLAGEMAWDPELAHLDEEAFTAAARERYGAKGRKPSPKLVRALYRDWRGRCGFGDGARVRFVSPRAAPVSRTAEQMHVFNLSTDFAATGFLSFVEGVRSLRFETRFADAVWLAGRELHATGRRRAVVVLAVGSSWDASERSAAEVRASLEKLQVPVFVWSFGAGPLHDLWHGRLIGESRDSVGFERDFELFEEACGELEGALAAQRVVRLEGPAGDVTLGTGASGVRLAGAPPEAAGGPP